LAPNTAIQLTGNHDYDAQNMIAYELGYRMKIRKGLSLDLAVFFNDYKDHQKTVPISDMPPVLQFDEGAEAESLGMEISLDWQVNDSWRLASSYSMIHFSISKGGNEDVEEAAPDHQFQVRSYYNISPQLELNSALYYFDNISSWDIPAYFRLDLGLTWKPIKNLELSLWGQNLLDDKHSEYAHDEYVTVGAGEIQRSFYGKITWRF